MSSFMLGTLFVLFFVLNLAAAINGSVLNGFAFGFQSGALVIGFVAHKEARHNG